jgi:hypothetical protein
MTRALSPEVAAVAGTVYLIHVPRPYRHARH